MQLLFGQARDGGIGARRGAACYRRDAPVDDLHDLGATKTGLGCMICGWQLLLNNMLRIITLCCFILACHGQRPEYRAEWEVECLGQPED